jgi:signal transduction histidine kinase
MRVTRPTVLILSSNPAFAREVAAAWPAAADPPEFTVLEQGLFREVAGARYDLAIADATSSNRSELKAALVSSGKPAILVNSERTVSSWPQQELAQASTSVIELSSELRSGRREDEKPAWPSIAGLLGREILRRRQAEERVHEAESISDASQAEATLGRYVAEMRHNINNALTSLLGNAELLTLEAELPGTVLTQAETILNMSRRLHEVFRRFASLQEELAMAARQSGRDGSKARSAASGK